jgi:hypothetical protein
MSILASAISTQTKGITFDAENTGKLVKFNFPEDSVFVKPQDLNKTSREPLIKHHSPFLNKDLLSTVPDKARNKR